MTHASKAIAILIVIVASGSLLLAVGGARAWSANLTWSDTTVYQGQPYAFNVSLGNGNGVTLEIDNYTFQACWDSAPWHFPMSPTDIPSGGSYTFHISGDVPATAPLGPCTSTLGVEAQAIGEPNPTWNYWTPSGAAFVFITVAPVPALSVSMTANPTSGNYPLPVGFTAYPTGGLQPYSYSWTFGDGNAGGNVAAPTHTYTASGIFTTTVIVTDQAGQQKSATATVTVSAPPPPPIAASITANLTAGTSPVSVQFNPTVSGGTPGYSYAWDFGDGTQSIATAPIHTYTAPGNYTVTLRVTDSAGKIQTATTIIHVSAAPAKPGLLGMDTTTATIVLGAIAAAIMVAVAVALIARRRRPAQPLPPPPPAPPRQ